RVWRPCPPASGAPRSDGQNARHSRHVSASATDKPGTGGSAPGQKADDKAREASTLYCVAASACAQARGTFSAVPRAAKSLRPNEQHTFTRRFLLFPAAG